MLSAIVTLSSILLLILFPLLIPALVTVGHALGTARWRRHRPRNGPRAAASRVFDHPRASAAGVSPLRETSPATPDADGSPDRDEPLRFPPSPIREPQTKPATKMVP